MLYEFGGIFGGAHKWRGLFSEFYSMSKETTRRVRLEPMPGPPDPEFEDHTTLPHTPPLSFPECSKIAGKASINVRFLMEQSVLISSNNFWGTPFLEKGPPNLTLIGQFLEYTLVNCL